ncbi:MAG TPA: hypothetical protein VN622_08800 [Clostridia bacterium]|nr:hypothetical protein [Clostridia bacterium]
MQRDSRLNVVWWTLRVGLGLGPFLAGADKFTNLLVNWPMYLNPLATRIVPVSPQTFMHMVGVVEMVVGLAILAGWTRWGGYIAMIWLLAIAGNLVVMGRFFDVAVRDVEIALSAFALARISEVLDAAGAKERRDRAPVVASPRVA